MSEIKETTGTKTTIESLRLIQLEKLLIISKEIGFIENILLYFKGYEKKEKENESKKDDIEKNFIYVNIRNLKYDIESIEKRIENLTKINNEILKASNSLKFLLFYDYIQTQIEEMLILLEGIYVKMNQLFGETLNQYLPYPTFFGRRFSSYGLMIYLDHYFKKLDNFLSEGYSKKNYMVLGWSYNTGFKHKILRNKNLLRIHYNHETHNDYIELPYWYYELPLLIPAITHEVVRISLRSKSSNIYNKKYKKFETTVLNFFKDKSNVLVQEINEVLGYEMLTKDFIKDIFSDILSFEIHGKAYFYTIFHNLVADGIAKDFLKIVYEDNGEKISRYEFRPNDWFFSLKRDHNHLRVYFLLYYWENKSKELKDYIEIEEIKEILNTIMDLSGDNNKIEGFKKLFKENYPNYYTTYEVVENYLQQLYKYLQLYIDKIDLNLNKDISEMSKYFNQLWEERFNLIKENRNNKKSLVPYKGSFRQIIHYNISEIEYLNPNKNNLEISVLTLRKLRKDKVNKFCGANKSKDVCKDYSKKFFEKINNQEKQNNKEKRRRAYGIYDIMILEKKDNIVDIESELNTINSKKKDDSIYYFDTKSVLMKVTKEIEGKKKDNSLAFGILINVELKKSSKSINGYSHLKNSIQNIREILLKNIMHFYKANIYKSLGPKDLSIIIEWCKVENSYKIIEYLNGIDTINRTSSIIISSGDNLTVNKSLSNICSYIRIPKKENNDLFKSIKEELKDTNANIYQTVGVMDYRIEWNNENSIQNIFNKYKEILPYITDYQTVIEKKISEPTCHRK